MNLSDYKKWCFSINTKLNDKRSLEAYLNFGKICFAFGLSKDESGNIFDKHIKKWFHWIPCPLLSRFDFDKMINDVVSSGTLKNGYYFFQKERILIRLIVSEARRHDHLPHTIRNAMYFVNLLNNLIYSESFCTIWFDSLFNITDKSISSDAPQDIKKFLIDFNNNDLETYFKKINLQK